MPFSEILGHTDIVANLRNMVDSDRMPHALLFTEKPGCGALPLALATLEYMFSRGRNPKVAKLVHPDVHFTFPIINPTKTPTSDSYITEWREMVASSDALFNEHDWYGAIDVSNQQGIIPKKEADNIIRKLSFKAFEGENKSVIIWLPERMNRESANTLLKILEEPWDKTLFILITERADRLLQTILSRTQEVAVPRLAIEDLMPMGQGDEQQRRNMARLAAGDLIEMRRLTGGEEDAVKRESFDLFCRLMRVDADSMTVSSVSFINSPPFVPMMVAVLKNRDTLIVGLGAGIVGYALGNHFGVLMASLLGLL